MCFPVNIAKFLEHLFWRRSANGCFSALILIIFQIFLKCPIRRFLYSFLPKIIRILEGLLHTKNMSENNFCYISSILVRIIYIQHINVILRFLWTQKPHQLWYNCYWALYELRNVLKSFYIVDDGDKFIISVLK